MKKRIANAILFSISIIFIMIYIIQVNNCYIRDIKWKDILGTTVEMTKQTYYNQVQNNLLKHMDACIQKSHDIYINSKIYIQEINSHSNEEYTIEEIDTSFKGVYSITAYTATGYPMANGEYPYVGCAASCDFPIGTVLIIEGIGTYVIKDVCPTSGVIDIYMNSYDECIRFGRQTANVYT